VKVLIVADWHRKIYAQAVYDAFEKLGYITYKFSWKEYFKHCQYSDYYDVKCNKIISLYYRLQNRFLIGPVLKQLNNDLIELTKNIQPDLIFIYRGTHIYPNTIKLIKSYIGCKVFAYNNDDPFSDRYKLLDFRLWSLYKKSIFEYDWIFSYRFKNIEDYKQLGYMKTSLLRSYYLKEKNFYISNIEKKYDVIFIGHFENDGRDESIKYLLENNIDVQIYGTLWENSKYFNFFKKKMKNIKPIYEDYNLMINSARIALVFLSKLNNDTYTRRCFEIPATKTMMLGEYTKDLANNLFEEGKESEYFRTNEELLKKVKYYLEDNSRIDKIGNAGYKRLISDGHEVENRIEQIMKIFRSIIDENSY